MDEVIESKPRLVLDKFLEYRDKDGNVSVKLKHLIIVLNNLEYKNIATGEQILFDNDATVTMDSSQNISIDGITFEFNDFSIHSDKRVRTFGFLEKRVLKYLVIVPSHIWQNSNECIIEELRNPSNKYPFTLYYQKDTNKEDLSIIRSVLSKLLQERLMLMMYLPIEAIIHPENAIENFDKIIKKTYDVINSIDTGFEGDENGTE